MQKNNVVTVTIEDIGVNGEGIGKVDGYTLFIKDAMIGDVIEAKVMKAKKHYGYARLQKILTSSEARVKTPACPMARKCGGCQIQEMKYSAQLAFKEGKVCGNLERIGGVPAELLDEIMEPVVGMERGETVEVAAAADTEKAGAADYQPFCYRNKAQFPIGTDKEGHVIAGFYAGRTHNIISNTDCILGVPVNKEILECILAFMEEYKILSYNEEKHTGLVRHVLIRYGFTTDEIMVCLILNGEELPYAEVLVERLRKIPGMTSITVNVNRAKTNVIMGDKIKLLWGQTFITDYIGNVKYQISPLSFYQVNPVQTEKLYELALDYADLTGEETVWDLYCGIGTISLFLAQKAKQVYGVEIVPQAIDDAKNNAKINGIKNAEFYVGKAEEVLPDYYEEYAKTHNGEKAHADVIVVDPPRKGCEESLLQTIVDMQPERVVYVSCDSATLARDVKFLREKGYELTKVRAVDQFPHTVHVETVCLLSKLHEAKHYVNVTVDMDEMDITSAESKAMYEEIKKYVAEHNDGMKVSSLNIAQVKAKCGIIERENYNLPKSGNAKQPQCPKEKEDAIVEALKYYQMI